MSDGEAGVSARHKVAELVKAEVHRPDFGLRLIIVWKCIKAVLMIGVGILALSLMHSDIHQLGVDLVNWLGIDPARPTIEKFLGKLTGLTPGRIAALGAGAIVYAGVNLLEAYGLHRRRTWAEWLTVILTSSLIPVEIYEIAEDATLGKVIALIVNIAIVIYLLRHRWLFVPGRVGRWLAAKFRRS
jgi:uncharacterized membrane protein (DUF2068 family)